MNKLNNKGFTLVEIIGVIALLAIIMIIATTSGLGAFNNTKTKIDELNTKAINEGAELLRVDIENCNDELDKDVYEDIFGKNSCEELQKVFTTAHYDVYVSLDKLVEKGYVNNSKVQEIEDKENVKIIFTKDIESNKIAITIPDTLNNDDIAAEEDKNKEKAILKATYKDSTEDYYNYKNEIIEINFVNKIDTTNAVENWDVTDSESAGKITAWIENSKEAGKYILYIGSYGPIYANANSSYLFNRFINLKYIRFYNFDTSEVTDMSFMFNNCNILKEIKFDDKFKTNEVTNMKAMFKQCNSLTELDLSNFNTSEVTDMSYMFYMTTDSDKTPTGNLKSIKFSEEFDTKNVINMYAMFYGQKELKELDLSSFNTSEVTDMSFMFGKNTALINLNIKNFNTTKVSSYSSMFSGTNNLKSICYTSDNIKTEIKTLIPNTTTLSCN